MSSHHVGDYQIGIICALPKELKAVRAILDEEHEPLKSKDAADHNSYVLGKVGAHNVVIAGLPAGVYGTTSAASVGKDMLRTFSELRFGLLVGIAGGIPDVQAGRDIRLGDVVVSQPHATHGGVVQYDLGKLLSDGQLVRKGTLNKPPQTLLTALTSLQAALDGNPIGRYLREVDEKYPWLKKEGYCYQGMQRDQLHCARCDPSRWWWMLWLLLLWFWPLWQCQRCVGGKISREPRTSTTPFIHYGTIASGNNVLTSVTKRDQLARELGALCVEMEAAGLDDYPCLVIRGICDYADASKNDAWQEYASITAAAFTKMLLRYISPVDASREQTIQQVLGRLDRHFQLQQDHNTTVEEQMKRQEIYYHDDKYRDCHRVFGSSDYERQKNINGLAVAGTCRWVLDHPQYCKWLNSVTSDLLWISADPGCGKSVLSRSLIDTEFTSIIPTGTSGGAGRAYTVCYFFFKDNEEQSGFGTALCAILHQLFSDQPELIRHAIPAYNKHSPDSLVKKIDELWRILESATGDPKAKPVICVLDALDECCDADRPLLINSLRQSYADSTASLKSKFQKCLKWLVTSRPHADIQGLFDRLPSDLTSIRLRGEEKNDQIAQEINLVIDHRITDLGRSLGLNDAKREEIRGQLRKMNNRTYLWLHLVLEDIEVAFRRSARPNQVEVPSLPATVDEAYENILKRIVDFEAQQYAKIVLTIIVGSPRPLSIAEMALAFDIATLQEAPRSLVDLTIDPSMLGDKIRSWCGLFVFVQHNRFYLIHQTAKEFLQSQDCTAIFDSGKWKHCLHPLAIDSEMAKICVHFLCLSEFDTTSRDAKNLGSDSGTESISVPAAETFFALASEHWGKYVRTIEYDLDDQMQSKVQALYDSNSKIYSRWTEIKKRYLPGMLFSRKTDISHSVAFNGHVLHLQHMISANPNLVNHFYAGESTLSVAASQGHMGVVKFLLSQPNIDVNLGEPLASAAKFGHTEIVQLLLRQPGIDINHGHEGALNSAAAAGHVEIVELLLRQPSIDINHGLKGALADAVKFRHMEIVELLLRQPGIDVNHGFNGALTEASGSGNIEIVELLLRQPGIDINHGPDGALTTAARCGHMEIVELLLRQPNIDINHGLDGALTSAARSGHMEIVELLLRQPNIDINHGCYGTFAGILKSGYMMIVEFLLHHPGIDFDDQEPLASEAGLGLGLIEFLELLLHRLGIDVNYIREGALTRAAGPRYTELVQLLLRQPSIDANRGHDGALASAAGAGHVEIVELLLRQPSIDINYGLDGALASAAGAGHIEVVELLLHQPGIDVNHGGPLDSAAGSGHIEIVQLLLHQPGIDVNHGRGALASAAGAGHVEIVELLLRQPSIDINHGHKGALASAARSGHMEVVELLLHRPGIDVNHADPLGLAIRMGMLEIAKLLLSQPGIDVEATRSSGDEDVIHTLAQLESLCIDMSQTSMELGKMGIV